MMSSSFSFGTNLEDFLFKDVNISSIPGLIAVLVLLFIATCLYEVIRLFLAKAKLRSSALRSSKHPQCISESTELIVEDRSEARERWRSFFVELALYGVEIVAAYLLMLAVMTYNAYIFFAVIIGSTLSFLFLGPKMMDIRIKNRNLKLPCRHCFRHSNNLSCATSNEVISTHSAETEVPSCHADAPTYSTSTQHL